MSTLRLFPRLLLLLGFALFVNSGFAATPLTLIYSGNLDGELEPCGCSDLGNFGGIKRRATLLDQLRKQHPTLVAISSGGLLSSEGPGDRLKSEYLLKGFKALDYDAIGVQWRDLAYGQGFIQNSGLPWVASNWRHSEFKHDGLISREISGKPVRLRVLNWLDPARSPQQAMGSAEPLVNADLQVIVVALQAAKKRGETTVLLSALPLAAAQAQLPMALIDILLIESAYEVFGEPQKIGATLVLQPGSRGMRIGHLDLRLGDQGQISEWKHEVIAMPESMPDAPRMAAWYEDFNAKVKADYLQRVELRKQRETGQSPYVGEQVCKTCHAVQDEVWLKTDHAVAFDDLESVNKAFDPSCIKCHTVAFEQDGGFVDMNITPHLLGVQCENCHGAGRKHVEASGKAPLGNATWKPVQMCAQCHVQQHSPGFDFSTYWPKIKH